MLNSAVFRTLVHIDCQLSTLQILLAFQKQDAGSTSAAPMGKCFRSCSKAVEEQ